MHAGDGDNCIRNPGPERDSMRNMVLAAALALFAVTPGSAQQRDTAAARDTSVQSDSAARADSIAAADSIRLVRELERIQNEPRARPEQPAPAAPTGGAGAANPNFLPNISAIGDLVGDLSPDGSTLESEQRFDIREVELALQAAVDPYFRGDFILGVSDLEGLSIEEAYLTATALPWQSQIRAGRFHMPIGKQNTTHRAELHTVEYPYVIQRFLGEEAAKGTGIYASKIFAPFGFYQELQLTAVDEIGEVEEELVTDEPANKRLSGLGYSARLRNYWDLSSSTNLELSASAATGKRPQPIACIADPDAVSTGCADFADAPGVNVRQSLVGADVTLRWRPLQQGLYKSFILQAEFMHQVNDDDPSLPAVSGGSVEYGGPAGNFNGAYVFARYQLTRRLFVGGRYDWLEDPDRDGDTFNAVSGYVQFFPSEFSKLVAGYERAMPPGEAGATDRIIIQATIAIGPHRPHPF